ncbi:MAG: hypothetical protein AAF399_07210 [Bacteroidota bacterium]
MKSYILLLIALVVTGFLAAQNVGINTNTPQATLDVNGTLKVGSLSGATTQMVVSDPDGNISVQAIPTSTTYTPGAGITISANVISNAAPDQIVTLTGAGATTITGSYPNFTITSTDLVNDADADPANEIQTLSISGSDLSLSNGGGTVDLSSFDSPWTTSGANIYRDVGNVSVGTAFPNSKLHVNAPTGEDGFRVQIDGSTKFFVGTDGGTAVGGFVTPPVNGLYVAGNTGLGTATPTERLHVNGNIRVADDSDLFGLDELFGFNDLRLYGDPNIGGNNQADLLIGANGNVGIGIGNNVPTEKLFVAGNIRVADDNDLYGLNTIQGFNDLRFEGDATGGTDMVIDAAGKVGIQTTAPAYELTINGDIGAVNPSGEVRILSDVDASDVGNFFTYGPTSVNTRLGRLNGFPNHGFLSIWDNTYNTNTTPKAGMTIDASGFGTVFADVKNFRMEHPNQPGKEIWYASLEGPEAGAYDRGTATLVNGEAEITFPEHFQLVANPQTMTITTSPWSADSKGLAVIERTETGFKVKELFSGTGNYQFDWEVKCVRKGFEDYQVIRNATDMMPAPHEPKR